MNLHGSTLLRRRLRRALGLALGASLALVAGCAPDEPETKEKSSVPGPQAEDGRPVGRWSRVQRGALTPEQEAAARELEAIGYASGSQEAGGRSGVTHHDPARTQPGWNFYTSGHAPLAHLMDLDGRVLHTWQAALDVVFPDPKERGKMPETTRFWRRARLLEDGSVLAIFEGHSLVKLDKDSNVLWKNRCGAHHDLVVRPDGSLLVLTREVEVLAEYGKDPVLVDYVSWLDAQGRETRRMSILEAVRRSEFQELSARVTARRGDLLHTNSLHWLDGSLAERLPAFRAGNLLISSRPNSFIGVLDPERETMTWALTGPFVEQHDPTVVPGGNLLLFDNGGKRSWSRALELDPTDGSTRWEYRGPADAPLFSFFCGTAARLANGNTLVTETDGGRALEVTREGQVVWEFWNPERAGAEGEFIAALFEVVRVPAGPYAWMR